MWFEYVERRLVDFEVRRVDKINYIYSQITKGTERPKKIMREFIRKDLKTNEFD